MTEIIKEVETKRQRIKWSLNKENMVLSIEDTKLDLTETIYPELSILDKYVYIYGIKQACSDSGAGIKDFEDRKKAVLAKFTLFISKSPDFLPQGRKKLTEEEKKAIKDKKIESLIAEMVTAGMDESMARSIAEKTFKA